MPGFGLLGYQHPISEKRITLTAFSRDNVPNQGEYIVLPRFPICTEGAVSGRQVDYLQYRLQAPSEGDSRGRLLHNKILNVIRRTTMSFAPE
jgi:hypothetical protein